MPIVHVTEQYGGRLRARSYLPNIARGHLVDATTIECRMAADLREMAGALGGVTQDDLVSLGWQWGQIAKHGEAAKRRAQAKANRDVQA